MLTRIRRNWLFNPDRWIYLSGYDDRALLTLVTFVLGGLPTIALGAGIESLIGSAASLLIVIPHWFFWAFLPLWGDKFSVYYQLSTFDRELIQKYFKLNKEDKALFPKDWWLAIIDDTVSRHDKVEVRIRATDIIKDIERKHKAQQVIEKKPDRDVTELLHALEQGRALAKSDRETYEEFSRS